MDDSGIASGGSDAVLIGGRRGSCGRLGRNGLIPVWIVFFPDLNILEEFSPVIRFYCRLELNRSAFPAASFEGRRSDKRAVRRRYGDIVSGNTKRCVCRGRAGERHTLSSPLLEGNAPTTFTCLGVGRDVHRVILKEISAPIRILDAGASERAVLDRHRIMGRAVAVRGVAVVRIHIDRVGAGVEATSSINGATGETGIGAVVFPLDRHIANPGQDCIPRRINTDAICIILTGFGYINLDLAGGVDGHIFACTQTVAVRSVDCRIARRGTGDAHRSFFGDGDIFLCENAVCFIEALCAIVCHIDGHFGIARDIAAR